MNRLFSARWLNFFLCFTMVTTQILPSGYSQDASQNFAESPDGRSVPVVSLEDLQENEQAKAEAAQAEKAAMEANSYLMSIKESPISKADEVAAAEPSMMESSSRPAKEAKLHSKAEVEEMAAMIVRSYLGNKSVQFEYEWNHPFMYASEQVVDQDNPTLFTPQQGSLTLSRKLGDEVIEIYTLTIGDQGLLFSSAEVKSGDKILSTISWGYDSNGVKTSESKNENLYDADGNQIESRSSWKNMTADGTVTNESTTETYSKYDGKNLVAQTTKSSNRYDNNGTPQTSESSTVLERKYAGEVVIYELITSRGSQNGAETSGSTSLKKVELDAAGHIVYSITESDSWSSYNGTKSEYHYSTIEKSAYNENGDLIEKVTRSENKSTGYSSVSETHLIHTYEGGFLVREAEKNSSTSNGNQNISWSGVAHYKRDAAGRPVFKETTSYRDGVEYSRSAIERTYLDEKSEKLTSEITKNFYLQGDSLKLNYLQSLKLEYSKEGVLLKTHHQRDSFYGENNTLSYRNTVETVYNTDGKPVSVISKSYYQNGNDLVLQSWSELKYRYSEKAADGKTHVTYSSRTEMNADGSVIYKEIKRYDPRFSTENPTVSEPRVMYDIAMPAYSYYMPVSLGWGGGLEKGLLSSDTQYFSTDEYGDTYLTSTAGDRYWLDGEGKAYKQRNYTKRFNQEGDKTSQIVQEYDLIGQPYNYGCCYAMGNGDMLRSGEGVPQMEVHAVSTAGLADAMLYRPYPYYYNSGRRLTLYDELRYDESGDVIFRKTQRNEYADGLLVSAKLVIRDGDVTRTIKETYAFDALGRASKIIRQVYGPKGQLQLTDERTYEYSGFGYRGYDYYSGRPYVTYGGAAASDKMMSSAIWAPWNAALVKSVRVSLTNHVTGESVKALIAYTNANPGNAAEGEILLIDPYYGSVPYNAADITGTYVNKEGISTPIQGRFKSDGNEHALPTEKLMELLISYAGKNTDPNEKAIQEAIDHFMGLFDFKGLSNEAIAKIRASIQVKSAKQDEWSNGCVGWNTPSTMCTMAFVRGLNITLELFGNEYEIHANRLDPAKTAAIAAINSWLNRGIDLSQIKIESSGWKENEGDAFLNGSLKGGNGEVSEPVFVVILSNTVTLETERFEVAFHGNVIISSRRFDSRGGLIYERFSDGWEADYEYNAGGGGFAGGSEDQFSKPMLWRGLTGIFLRDGTHFVHVSFDVPQNDASKTAGAVKSVLLDLIARGELAKGKYQMDMRSFQESDMGCTAGIPPSCISSIAAIFTLGGFKFEYRISVITRGNLEAKFSAEQISKSGNIEEVPSPVVTGTFHVPDDSLISTLQRSVYTVSGEAQAWLIDRLPEWRKILDKLDGMKVSFIPGDSFSLEGQEIFTSGILITEDGRAYVLADGKIKQYKDAQFITLSESHCPANPMMGAPCSDTKNLMKMPGYEIIHQHEEVLLDGVWVIRRTVALIALPDDGTVSEYKSDEQLLSELHPNSKVLIYEEFDHVATACAPIDGAVCSSAKKVFYSYLRENGDRVYQIASINETRVFGGDDVKRTAHVVSEADLERALRAAGFHALQDSGDIFSGIINYNKMHVEKYEALPGDATDDLRSIPYHVVYSVLDCPDGPGLKSCATENYEARVVKSRIQIPEADAYLKYEVSFSKETRLIVKYGNGQEAYVDWIKDEEGALIRTDVKTGEEVKFVEARDVMSCSYPKNGPSLCADYALLEGHEVIGYYKKPLADGGYEDRFIMGLPADASNLPVAEKGSPVVTGIFQMPDDSMMSTLQRSVYTVEGEKESWLIDRLEELRDTLDTLHGQKVSFIPGKSFSLEGREIFTSGIIITADGIAFVIEDGKIKSYKDAQFLKVSESRCPANPAMGAPCSIEEMAMKMPGYEQIHQHQEVFVKDGWIVTRTIVLIGIPFEFKPNFIPVEKMDSAEADRIRKAVGEGLELLGYEIEDGRPYDGNLVHHYAFRALSSSLVHMQQATNMNIIKQDANGLIYEERELEDFGLDVFVNDEIRFIKEPDPRYIEVSAGVSRIEVAPGEQLMLSVVMELGGRRIMTLRDVHTPWSFTPLTQESAFRIKAAIHHGLEMKQIGKVRMKLTGETAAKCPQGEKCSSYKEYEVLYYADGKDFLADGQIILTTFQGKQFTYYEIQNIREAMSKEEKIRLAIEAAGQDLEALAAQMIIPENQALTEEEFAALDAKLKEIAEKMRALLVALREKIREIEGDDSSDGIIKMFGGPDAAVRLEQRAGALLSDFYGRLMRTDALIVAGGQKVRIPVHKMTEILVGALPSGRWSPAEDYAKLIGYTPEFHPGDGIYLMNVFQHVMYSLAMGPSLRDLRDMVKVFVMKSDAKGLVSGGTVNLRVFKSLLLGTQEKIDSAIKAAGEEIDSMLKSFVVADVLSEQEVATLLSDLDSLYEKIRARLSELKEQINELERANEDPSEPVLFMQFGGGPEGAVKIERDAEIALGNLYGLIVSRDLRIKTADGSEVVLPLSKMIQILSDVVGKDQMYSVEAIGKVLGLEVGYDSGRIYFMHVFQFMIAARALVPDVRTALIEYVRGADMPSMAQGGQLDLNLFRLSLLGARAKIQEAVAEAYLKAASDAGIFFFKAPEISLKKMTITSMSKNLPPTEFGLEVLYTADGGGELSASVQLSITADGIQTAVTSIKTPFGDSPEEIALAAIADLSRRTGLSPDNFKIQSTEAQNWPDGCLGLPEPGAFCTMAIVPGYRIQISDVTGKVYIYRSGRNKNLLKLEPLSDDTKRSTPKETSLAVFPENMSAQAVGSSRRVFQGLLGGNRKLIGYSRVETGSNPDGSRFVRMISDIGASKDSLNTLTLSNGGEFSIDPENTHLLMKGSVGEVILKLVDADGRIIEKKVQMNTESFKSVGFSDMRSGNSDFDFSRIASLIVVHENQKPKAKGDVVISWNPDAGDKTLKLPEEEESLEIKGSSFDGAVLSGISDALLKQNEVFGGSLSTPAGAAAYVSRIPQSDGAISARFHLVGAASEAGLIQPLQGVSGNGKPLVIAMKGNGKVLVTLTRSSGETVTRALVLNDQNYENFNLGEEEFESMIITSTRALLSENGKAEKGEFFIKFSSATATAVVSEVKARNTMGPLAKASLSKRISSHERFKAWWEKRWAKKA